MRFQVTTEGLAAAFAASNQGPEIRIAKFRIGAAYGYDAVISDGNLHGAELHVGTPVGYRVLNPNQCEFSIVMDEHIGTFDFGEIGLYLESGALFALGTLQRPQIKIAFPDQDFNRFVVKIRLTLAGAIPKIELIVNTLVAGSIWELPSVEDLPLPADTQSNVYLCHSQDHNGNDAFATLNPALKRWSIHSHMNRVESGTVLTVNSNATQISAGNGRLHQADVVPGRYLIQLTSGANRGQVRRIATMGGGTAAWNNPLSVAVGDTYELLRDYGDTSGGGEDAAFFFSILGANQ